MKRETTLEEYLETIKAKTGDKWKALRVVYEKTQRGEIKLYDTDPPVTFTQYLLRLDYTLWFWTSITLVLLTVIVVYVTALLPQLYPVRYFLGTLYTLFLPGYALVEALYPGERDLKPLERLALSIGLSLAVVPLIGLVLNYTPWGIRLGPVLIALCVYTAGILLLAVYRKYQLHKTSVISLKKVH